MSRAGRRRLEQHGFRPWSEAPDVHAIVTAPILLAKVGACVLQTCAHLDGLNFNRPDRMVFWAPSVAQALLCEPCLLAETAALEHLAGVQEETRRRCGACGELEPVAATFTSPLDDPEDLIVVHASICAGCLT